MASGVVGNLLAALPYRRRWELSTPGRGHVYSGSRAGWHDISREYGGSQTCSQIQKARSLFLKILIHTPQFFIITLWNSCTTMVYVSFMTLGPVLS